jgi:hypothetical protein
MSFIHREWRENPPRDAIPAESWMPWERHRERRSQFCNTNLILSVSSQSTPNTNATSSWKCNSNRASRYSTTKQWTEKQGKPVCTTSLLPTQSWSNLINFYSLDFSNLFSNLFPWLFCLVNLQIYTWIVALGPLPENMEVNPNKISEENPFGIWLGVP